MDYVILSAVVGCLLKNDKGKILLVKHHKRGWEIPQGRIEPGESIVRAQTHTAGISKYFRFLNKTRIFCRIPGNDEVIH